MLIDCVFWLFPQWTVCQEMHPPPCRNGFLSMTACGFSFLSCMASCKSFSRFRDHCCSPSSSLRYCSSSIFLSRLRISAFRLSTRRVRRQISAYCASLLARSMRSSSVKTDNASDMSDTFPSMTAKV